MGFFDSPFLRGTSLTHTQLYSQFPDPFQDYANLVQPRDCENVLKWAQYLWGRLDTWRAAGKRVVRYFLTDIVISGGDEGEKRKVKKFLKNTLHVMEVLALIGDDFMAYGNSFTTLYLPFRRFLVCPKCKTEYPSWRLDYKFSDLKFHASCDACKYMGEMEHVDRRSLDEQKICIIRWNPHNIRIRLHPLSGDAEYIVRIPEELKRGIRDGDKFYLESTPWEVILAVHQDRDLKLNPGVLYHMKEPTLAGFSESARGWGIPSILFNFSQAYRIQTLRRYDEALCMDFIVPWRIFCPKAIPTEGDPMKDVRLGDFNYHIMEMIHQHRQDPTAWHAVPFPLDYQAIGGEARNLVPTEITNQAIDELLNSCGYPAEMYRGTLQVQAAPTALRLFQQTWTHLVALFNDWLDWLLEQLSIHMEWDRMEAHLQPVTLADDLEKRHLQMQLAAGGMISRSTALATLGLDFYEEMKKMIDDQLVEIREQERVQKSEMKRRDIEARLQGMGIEGPAAPATLGTSGIGMTPQQILEDAEALAQQLFAIPDYRTRRQYLQNLKNSNNMLYHLVKGKYEQMQQDARSQGGAMIQQQAAGMPRI